jgi:ornithine cyclodeaminase/alanine dehydrogenase-like protein (mu-crystallin family)
VFGCTPSTEPLFDGRVWESVEGRKKGRLVVAIGSYTPEMREVPGELIRRALVAGEREAGVVVVDTIEGALKEAGELIEAGVRPEQLVE